MRDLIVGNEPNVNRFWQPQFGPDGESAAPRDYLALLASVYDAVEEAEPDVRVWGGALGPRGSDRPNGARPTHSPGTFIRELGEALRASGRTEPVLDGFAFHPYPETASTPPDVPHPNPRSRTLGLADIDRLQGLLHEAFGRDVPVLYSELGFESAIPPAKASLYEGTSSRIPSTSRRRPTSIAVRSSWQRARRASSGCLSSTRTTSLPWPASSPARTTSTGRPSRACLPCATPSRRPGRGAYDRKRERAQ